MAYYRSDKNMGLAFPYNQMARDAKYDLIMFIGNDHYLLPNWDEAVLEVANTKARWRAPMGIERERPTRSLVGNFGTTPETFREEELLKQCKDRTHQYRHICGYVPNVMYKSDFFAIGGFDETKFLNYTDFMWRAFVFCKRNGIQQLTHPRSFHYHFRSVTTELVEWKGEKVDFRRVLKQENIEWYKSSRLSIKWIDRSGENPKDESIDMDDSMHTELFSHFKIYGISVDTNGNLISYN
jgi:hypothetical protein